MSDPLLNLLAGACDIPAGKKARQQLIADCQRCNQSTMVKPYPAFYRLLNWGGNDVLDEPDADSGRLPLEYLSDAYFVDMLVWYHLAWMGETVRRDNELIQQLMEKGRVLDSVYVPARYPNGHPEGAPFEHYGPLKSEEAIRYAGEIIEFVRVQMA